MPAEAPFPQCPGCGRSNLTWWACKDCQYVGCDVCWNKKKCPSCDSFRKQVRKQTLDLGESWLVTRLTFNKRGEYVPYEILGRLLTFTKLVDLPELKASAALLVGGLSFTSLWFKIDLPKLVAAGTGMVIPMTYLICRALKGPIARWQVRVMDNRGGRLWKLREQGHLSISLEDARRSNENNKD